MSKIYNEGRDDYGNQIMVPQHYTADSADVRPVFGPKTQPRRRDKQGVTTLVKIAEFPAGANISEITIKCRFNTSPADANALAALSDLHGVVVIDPANDTLAALYDNLQNSVTTDSQFETVDISIPGNMVTLTITLDGKKNAAGDYIKNGTLGGGVIYAKSSDETTSLNFEVTGQ